MGCSWIAALVPLVYRSRNRQKSFLQVRILDHFEMVQQIQQKALFSELALIGTINVRYSPHRFEKITNFDFQRASNPIKLACCYAVNGCLVFMDLLISDPGPCGQFRQGQTDRDAALTEPHADMSIDVSEIGLQTSV
jgi:hypothetical protein